MPEAGAKAPAKGSKKNNEMDIKRGIVRVLSEKHKQSDKSITFSQYLRRESETDPNFFRKLVNRTLDKDFDNSLTEAEKEYFDQWLEWLRSKEEERRKPYVPTFKGLKILEDYYIVLLYVDNTPIKLEKQFETLREASGCARCEAHEYRLGGHSTSWEVQRVRRTEKETDKTVVDYGISR